MIRLTTPTHSFLFETDPSVYERILITYAQGSRIVLEKEKEDLTIAEEQTEEGTVWSASFRLTQEETGLFSAKTAVRIQVRVLTAAGEALASEMKTVSVSDVLNDGVLT